MAVTNSTNFADFKNSQNIRRIASGLNKNSAVKKSMENAIFPIPLVQVTTGANGFPVGSVSVTIQKYLSLLDTDTLVAADKSSSITWRDIEHEQITFNIEKDKSNPVYFEQKIYDKKGLEGVIEAYSKNAQQDEDDFLANEFFTAAKTSISANFNIDAGATFGYQIISNAPIETAKTVSNAKDSEDQIKNELRRLVRQAKNTFSVFSNDYIKVGALEGNKLVGYMTSEYQSYISSLWIPLSDGKGSEVLASDVIPSGMFMGIKWYVDDRIASTGMDALIMVRGAIWADVTAREMTMTPSPIRASNKKINYAFIGEAVTLLPWALIAIGDETTLQTTTFNVGNDIDSRINKLTSSKSEAANKMNLIIGKALQKNTAFKIKTNPKFAKLVKQMEKDENSTYAKVTKQINKITLELSKSVKKLQIAQLEGKESKVTKVLKNREELSIRLKELVTVKESILLTSNGKDAATKAIELMDKTQELFKKLNDDGNDGESIKKQISAQLEHAKNEISKSYESEIAEIQEKSKLIVSEQQAKIKKLEEAKLNNDADTNELLVAAKQEGINEVTLLKDKEIEELKKQLDKFNK